ncbi:aspartate kinase [Shewanella sp. JM162201]|uniref:Aspartokinase n=1 Tax=Shewanella jiangmenensis TaxID=2837387 RepID=A0ABS5UZ18_9GAMM|nr:aspartate kinase [Shewanella jiangmenensis]
MTKINVKKFGGTSVGSFERIEAVADAIARAHHEGERQVLVLSAMAGETNRLYAMAANIDPVASARELDMLVTAGEQVSIALMAMALERRGIKARSLLGSQVKIRTNNQFGRASIELVETNGLIGLLDAGVVPVIAGFQGVDGEGNITTLGRGGSDTTAVAVAAALNAAECQIFTDVCGVFTTDPNIDPNAQKLDSISFEAMYEMARQGAKVLHPDSVACARRHGVVLRVLSSFEPGSGTLIRFDEPDHTVSGIVGIAVSRGQGLVSVSGVVDNPPAEVALFKTLADACVDTDLVAQQPSERMLSFSLAQAEVNKVLALIDTLTGAHALGAVNYETELAKVSLISTGKPVMAELAARVTELLAAQNIRVRLVSTAEIKLSVMIDEKDLQQAVRSLHRAFNLNKV